MEHALTPDPFDALPRPRRRPQEHGRTPFDGLRPWSAITHGIGAALAILGTVLLLVKAVITGADAWKLVSFSIYGASMIGLYTASTLYHSVHTTASKRIALRKYDHASIYFLIAGTYTPVCLTALRGPWGWSMFGIIWALAIAGLVMTLAWITLLFTVLSFRKLPVILPFGLILSGFALLVASIGESDPQISHLMPVLSSPLLSVHVTCMMISYSLLGLAMLDGVMALVRYAVRMNGDSRRETDIAVMKDMSLVILYPAVFFLVTGTFLGAVWADISWGRYWAWDPKEVWALITILVYAFSLHGRSLMIFRNPVFFHWYCILAFLCVIVTYFGVNFFLGGLHSYA